MCRGSPFSWIFIMMRRPAGSGASRRRIAIGGVQQVSKYARLVEGVPRIGHDVQPGFRPGTVQLPRGAHGRASIVPPLHDDAGHRRAACARRGSAGLRFHEALVHEIVVLDAREGQRGAGRPRGSAGGAGSGSMGDGAVFPSAPRLWRRGQLRDRVGAGQAAVIGLRPGRPALPAGSGAR